MKRKFLNQLLMNIYCPLSLNNFFPNSRQVYNQIIGPPTEDYLSISVFAQIKSGVINLLPIHVYKIQMQDYIYKCNERLGLSAFVLAYLVCVSGQKPGKLLCGTEHLYQDIYCWSLANFRLFLSRQFCLMEVKGNLAFKT